MKTALIKSLAMPALLYGGYSYAQTLQRGLIKEVIELSDHATLPPYIYKKYTSDMIASSIVERIRAKNKIANSPFLPYFNFSEHGQILVQFKEKIDASSKK